MQYFHLKKQYKQYVKRVKNDYESNLWKTLEGLNNRNPKAFWEMFNKFSELEKQHKQNPISAETWVEHFKSLLNRPLRVRNDIVETITGYLNSKEIKIFNELNFKITESEVIDSLASLKRNKSPGIDGLVGEILIASCEFISKPLHSFFNSIFLSGHFPSNWQTSTLTPLHKKGYYLDPNNYRGIAVSSCLSKVFLTILHKRLESFVEKHKLIPDTQIGYKKGARTTDHILCLKNIIDKYIFQKQRKYLYVCFVDFKAAFDTLWRDALFYKLLHKGIGGNFIDIIQAMYRNVYYCVKLPHGITPSFESTVGVKQGCVLSPILFNLFLSDLPDIFTHECDPVSLGNRFVSCLMFADDLVILSETPAGLQSALSKLQKYTEDWNLTINTNKTKVIIFNKGGHKISKFKFLVNSEELEIVQNYCYLGLIFSSCFTEACKNLVSKASKAFFKLTQLNVKEKVPVALKLFDSLVTPILSYASEVWGPTYLKKLDKADFRVLCDTHVVEKLNVKLCKYLLCVNKKSVNSAVLGELGRLPVLIKILSQSFKFWIRAANFPKEH